MYHLRFNVAVYDVAIPPGDFGILPRCYRCTSQETIRPAISMGVCWGGGAMGYVYS